MDAWCVNQAVFVQLFKKIFTLLYDIRTNLDVITTWIVIYLALEKIFRLFNMFKIFSFMNVPPSVGY